MNESSKKALLVFGGGALLFILLKYVFKVQDEKEKIKKEEKENDNNPVEDKREQQKNAIVLKKAFIDAVQNGENAQFLNEMNREFAKTYGMKVHKSKSKGKVFVADLQGNVILE